MTKSERAEAKTKVLIEKVTNQLKSECQDLSDEEDNITDPTSPMNSNVLDTDPSNRYQYIYFQKFPQIFTLAMNLYSHSNNQIKNDNNNDDNNDNNDDTNNVDNFDIDISEEGNVAGNDIDLITEVDENRITNSKSQFNKYDQPNRRDGKVPNKRFAISAAQAKDAWLRRGTPNLKHDIERRGQKLMKFLFKIYFKIICQIFYNFHRTKDMVQALGNGISQSQINQLQFTKNKSLKQYHMKIKEISTENKILNGYKIALAGMFTNGDHECIKETIVEEGGEFCSKAAINEINLVIIGSKTKSASRFINQAISRGKTIVDEEWLFDSIFEGKMLEFNDYPWNSNDNHSMFTKFLQIF